MWMLLGVLLLVLSLWADTWVSASNQVLQTWLPGDTIFDTYSFTSSRS